MFLKVTIVSFWLTCRIPKWAEHTNMYIVLVRFISNKWGGDQIKWGGDQIKWGSFKDFEKIGNGGGGPKYMGVGTYSHVHVI